MATASEVRARRPHHDDVKKRLVRVKRRLDKASAALDAIQHERAALYVEARELDPPITYKTIADIFGTTEAAAIQMVTRQQKAQG